MATGQHGSFSSTKGFNNGINIRVPAVNASSITLLRLIEPRNADRHDFSAIADSSLPRNTETGFLARDLTILDRSTSYYDG